MNINKRLISFLLAVMMIVTVVPVFAADEAAAPVDLIHSAAGKLREGVFITAYGNERNANQHTNYLYMKAIDGSTGTQWLAAGSSAWYQVNFPVAQKISEIVVYGSSAAGFNHLFKVLASNDHDFATSVTLLDQTTAYSGGSFKIDDATLLETPYKYIRVAASGDTLFGIAEIKINGYLESLPSATDLVDLTGKADVTAKVAEENADSYKAQQVIDGNVATGYSDTVGEQPELVVDLKRAAIIERIEYTPLTGSAGYRQDYEIHLSNDPLFADFDVIYSHLRGMAATAEGSVVRAYGISDTPYRYVRIKSNMTKNGTDALGVAELKVLGTETDSSYVLTNMTSASCVTATSGENMSYLVDGDVSTAYKSAAEDTKSAITFDVDGATETLLPATSIMLLPVFDEANEEIRANFNIYGSVLGDFTDSVLIGSVDAPPVPANTYYEVDIDVVDLYKKIKIEKASAPTADEGLGFYEVKIIHNSTDDDYILYLAQALINECISDFKTFPSSLTMSELLTKWTTDDPDAGVAYIQKSELVDGISGTLPTEYDKVFEYLCDIYDADGKMETVSDITDCLNAAYVITMYETSDKEAVKAALLKYEGDINGLYSRINSETKEEIIDVEKYTTVYQNLKSNVTDVDSFKEVLKWSTPLSVMQGGTKADVRYIIENYNDILGCDLAYAADNNVTTAQIIAKIETSDAAKYFKTFDTVYKGVVDDIIAENSEGTDDEESDEESSIVSPGVGSIGVRPSTGGGGGGSTKPKEEKEDKEDEDDKKEEKPVTPEPIPEEKVTFNDISDISWAKEHIESLASKGIISGDGDGKFHPNRYVTREEFLKMLIEALKINVSTNEAAEFLDCDPGAWYYPYILIASTNKIVNGIDRKNFGIGRNITRQDMAVLISKALGIKSVTAIESDFEFADNTAIAEYAQSDVSKMYSLGMISGFEDGTFGPTGFTTRAQAAVIIGRALEKTGGASN